MIKVKDIRLGSYYSYDGNVKKTDVIWMLGLYKMLADGVANENSFLDQNLYSGVPLTPEWLERAGFEKVADRQWQMKHELPTKRVMIIEDKWISGTNGKLGFNYSNENQHGYVSLFWVHQFQNLIHALTGKELEFNLDNLN